MGSGEQPARGLVEHATEPGKNAWGEEPRFTWEAPGGVDRASSGPAAHVLFPPQRLHEGFTEEVVWLLDKADPAVDVNLLDGGGRTALHFAAGWGRLECVQALMARGASLETRDAWHKAPVDWALQAHQSEVVQLMRIEAVKRGVWGGRGQVAPLTTMTEATVGKTHEEVQRDVQAFTEKVFEDHLRRDEEMAAAA